MAEFRHWCWAQWSAHYIMAAWDLGQDLDHFYPNHFIHYPQTPELKEALNGHYRPVAWWDEHCTMGWPLDWIRLCFLTLEWCQDNHFLGRQLLLICKGPLSVRTSSPHSTIPQHIGGDLSALLLPRWQIWAQDPHFTDNRTPPSNPQWLV